MGIPSLSSETGEDNEIGEEERSVQIKDYFHTARDLRMMKVVIHLVRVVIKMQIKIKNKRKRTLDAS